MLTFNHLYATIVIVCGKSSFHQRASILLPSVLIIDVSSFGKTYEEALENLQEALELYATGY